MDVKNSVYITSTEPQTAAHCTMHSRTVPFLDTGGTAPSGATGSSCQKYFIFLHDFFFFFLTNTNSKKNKDNVTSSGVLANSFWCFNILQQIYKDPVCAEGRVTVLCGHLCKPLGLACFSNVRSS